MRSFVVFALLALALCQNPFQDTVTGFTTQLGFTDAQTADANTCLTGVFGQLQGLAPLYMDYLSHDLTSFITDAIMIAQTFEPAVKAACEPFVQDIFTYAATFGNGSGPKINFAMNGPYVAQELALLFQHIATGNFTGLGETVGYLYQIGVGSVDLEIIAPQRLTYEQAQLLQQNAMTLFADQASLTEYLQAYVNELGVAENVNVPAIAQLVGEAQGFIVSVMTLRMELASGTFDSDITAIETFITSTLEIVRNNQEAFRSIAVIDGPVLKALFTRPLKFIGTTIFNALLNAPKAIELNNQVQNDLIAGDFTAAGTDAATFAKIYYGQVYAN